MQVRRKGTDSSKTFRLKSDAKSWALETERTLSNGKSPTAHRIDRRCTFSELIQLHIADLWEVGKPPRRSKAASLEKLRISIGQVRVTDLTRERLIEFAKSRTKEGAGPVTISMDVGYIRTVLIHAAAIHGLEVPTEQVTLARLALLRLGLIGKGTERDRRPTPDELTASSPTTTTIPISPSRSAGS